VRWLTRVLEVAGKRAAIKALFIRTSAQVLLTIPQLEAGRSGRGSYWRPRRGRCRRRPWAS